MSRSHYHGRPGRRRRRPVPPPPAIAPRIAAAPTSADLPDLLEDTYDALIAEWPSRRGPVRWIVFGSDLAEARLRQVRPDARLAGDLEAGYRHLLQILAGHPDDVGLVAGIRRHIENGSDPVIVVALAEVDPADVDVVPTGYGVLEIADEVPT